MRHDIKRFDLIKDEAIVLLREGEGGSNSVQITAEAQFHNALRTENPPAKFLWQKEIRGTSPSWHLSKPVPPRGILLITFTSRGDRLLLISDVRFGGGMGEGPSLR